MTKTAKVVHWTLLSCLAYCAGLFVTTGTTAIWVDVSVIAFWSFLALMVYQRPRSWGIGVGVFLLCLIPVHAWLWHLAVTRPSPYQGFLEDATVNWVRVSIVGLPIIVGGICGVTLRWLCPAQQMPPDA